MLLSIGVNRYEHLRTLSYCANDATTMQAALSARLPQLESTVLVSTSAQPNDATKSRVDGALAAISGARMTADDLLVFYFAGHGFSALGKDYLAVYGTETRNPSTAICTDDVLSHLGSSGAGTAILILDACRSEVDRSPTSFGESTAELARRKGSIVFFSCSPGETSQELGALGNGHGVFTYAFIASLKSARQATPLILNQRVVQEVEQLCIAHNLSKQRPYTAVAPIDKAMLDVITGEFVASTARTRRNMVLVLGPTNAGKTTLGQLLATELGYPHSEMSSFAWKRYDEWDQKKQRSIQDFMEDVVWTPGNEDLIARDMLAANAAMEHVVVCGPRRPEEVETILQSGWNVVPIFIHAHTGLRFGRFAASTAQTRHAPDYSDFVKRDMRELAWGVAKTATLPRVDLITNEGDLAAFKRDALVRLRALGVKK
jgi:hypothetical protein